MANHPDPREVLANERTFLSWLRTGISLMAFGFVVSKFNLFLQITVHHPAERGVFGLVLVAGGVITIALATWHFHKNFVRLRNGEPLINMQFPLMTGILMIVLGVGVFIYLTRTPGY